MTRLRVLIVEDSEGDCALVLRCLKRGGFDVDYRRVDNGADLDKALQAGGWDLIICDYALPQFNAPAALAMVKASGHDIPFIVVSGTIGEEIAVQMMRAGAHDYLLKDNLLRLGPAVERELREAAVRAAGRQAEEALCESEKTLRLVLEATQDGVWDWAIQTGTVHYSPGWSRILGYDPSETQSNYEFWESRIHRDDRTATLDILKAHLEGHSPVFATEHRLRTKEGWWKWVLGRGRIVERNPDGTPLRAVGTMTDITERKDVEEALRQSEESFRSAFENTPIGMAIVGLDESFLRVNQALCSILGYTKKELLAKTVPSITHPDDNSADAIRKIPIAAGATRHFHAVRRYIHADGHVVWAQLSVSLVTDSHGKPLYYISQLEDVTERKLAEEQLRLAAKVFDASNEAIMIADGYRRILVVNDAFTEITGYAPDEVIGTIPAVLDSGHHNPEFYVPLWHSLNHIGHWRGEIFDRRKNGEPYPQWTSISAVRNPDGELTHYVAIFSDISERKDAEARIEYLAHHDALTDLPNRMLLRDRLEHALAHAEREKNIVALLFLDLDHFKVINDSLGHLVGDKLLQAVAQRLVQCVRETDTVSRHGGDEFLILLTDSHDTDAVARTSQKILDQLAQPFDIDGHTLSTSFSIGITLYPADGIDFGTLLKHADTALYHAKQSGRNAYHFFTEAMNATAQERMQLESRLRQAIERNEFTLHYQPQVELGSGRVIGAEALIRWNSPELGQVSPARFIPIAEDSGLILQIGEWVLYEACRQARAWQKEGIPGLVVAVNVSAVQLRRGNLPDSVANALEQSGLDSSHLELELTESMLLQDVDHVFETVQELSAMGITLSIDDFGTGYSSMSYLKRLAINKLKIDQSFVRDLTSDPEDAAIVRAVIEMARSLKLTTIAEGVETEQQLNLLKNYACDQVQGYHLSRPLPADEFCRLLATRDRWMC